VLSIFTFLEHFLIVNVPESEERQSLFKIIRVVLLSVERQSLSETKPLYCFLAKQVFFELRWVY
jgi:hypothetical protein